MSWRLPPLWLLVVSLAWIVGCGAASEPAGPPHYPGTLRPASELGDDVMMRQTLEADWGDGQQAFEAVLQKQGGELVLLGLGPHGGRAFLLEHRGGEARLETFVDLDLPFPPRYVLLDVQRTFFPYLSAEPLDDGVHEEAMDGERVRETWRDGKLLERTFERLDGEPQGVIRVDYGPGMVFGQSPPAEIAFHNGWFGYVLRVRTVDYRPL